LGSPAETVPAVAAPFDGEVTAGAGFIWPASSSLPHTACRQVRSGCSAARPRTARSNLRCGTTSRSVPRICANSSELTHSRSARRRTPSCRQHCSTGSLSGAQSPTSASHLSGDVASDTFAALPPTRLDTAGTPSAASAAASAPLLPPNAAVPRRLAPQPMHTVVAPCSYSVLLARAESHVQCQLRACQRRCCTGRVNGRSGRETRSRAIPSSATCGRRWMLPCLQMGDG
jgi:hypothetical protein